MANRMRRNNHLLGFLEHPQAGAPAGTVIFHLWLGLCCFPLQPSAVDHGGCEGDRQRSRVSARARRRGIQAYPGQVHYERGTAATCNITATPTFLFFRNKVKIDQYQGADATALEEKIKQHLENDPGNNEDVDIPKGYMDLLPFINKAGCECLNESDDHGFDNCLRKDSTYLESDCDEQLLMTVAFNQPVKLYSMKLQGPENGQGPKFVKIFINLPRSMDFDEAMRSEPTQAVELTQDDIKEDGIIQLRYVKFQNVNSVTLFIQSNQSDEETTKITYFTFIGTPVQATNMNDFKRVVGKKGESH
ncbi:thioredoxin-like protein 1 [Microcaecilia unicolor]|uniref:Thioredoxin-like protein 1 n=1 Tax=Microcaecilia unicolor TaxID=1415580 RepID=A0A6P7X5L6_9AMPH|nr:thioredoxin-like protein 1 [Microcaecilia unicolor]